MEDVGAKQASISGDTMIGEPAADKQIRRPTRPKAKEERLEVKSVAAIRQLHGGAVVNVDGNETTIVGKKVSILIEG